MSQSPEPYQQHNAREPNTRAKDDQTRHGQTIAQLDKLAWLLDESVRLPGGFKIGVESIVGLVPGFGDALGFLLSLVLVIKARNLGASRGLQSRMLANSVIESAIGTIPLLGDVFDFWFKANKRNIKLLRDHLVSKDSSSNVSSSGSSNNEQR